MRRKVAIVMALSIALVAPAAPAAAARSDEQYELQDVQVEGWGCYLDVLVRAEGNITSVSLILDGKQVARTKGPLDYGLSGKFKRVAGSHKWRIVVRGKGYTERWKVQSWKITKYDVKHNC